MKRTRTCNTPSCDGILRDTGVVCDGCVRDLERALGDVAAIADRGRHLALELLTTATRRSRLGDDLGRGRSPAWTEDDLAWPQTTASHPLPFDWAGSDLLWVLGNTLSTWARVLLDEPAVADAPRDGTSPKIAAWLLCHLEDVRHHEAAVELVDEIVACVQSVSRAVDRPADRWYAGPCFAPVPSPISSKSDGESSSELSSQCEYELYASGNSETIRCPKCGTEWDLAARREWLLKESEDVLAPASDIARAVTLYAGVPVTATLVRVWANRKRILPHGEDHWRGKPRPLYRVGDVLDLIAQSPIGESSRHAAASGS